MYSGVDFGIPYHVWERVRFKCLVVEGVNDTTVRETEKTFLYIICRRSQCEIYKAIDVCFLLLSQSDTPCTTKLQGRGGGKRIEKIRPLETECVNFYMVY